MDPPIQRAYRVFAGGGRFSKLLHYARVEVTVACTGCEATEDVFLESDQCASCDFELNY